VVAKLLTDLAAVGSPLLAKRVKARSPTAYYIFSYTAKLGALGAIRYPLLRSAAGAPFRRLVG
jgi:hypothetical protein